MNVSRSLSAPPSGSGARSGNGGAAEPSGATMRISGRGRRPGSRAANRDGTDKLVTPCRIAAVRNMMPGWRAGPGAILSPTAGTRQGRPAARMRDGAPPTPEPLISPPPNADPPPNRPSPGADHESRRRRLRRFGGSRHRGACRPCIHRSSSSDRRFLPSNTRTQRFHPPAAGRPWPSTTRPQSSGRPAFDPTLPPQLPRTRLQCHYAVARAAVAPVARTARTMRAERVARRTPPVSGAEGTAFRIWPRASPDSGGVA